MHIPNRIGQARQLISRFHHGPRAPDVVQIDPQQLTAPKTGQHDVGIELRVNERKAAQRLSQLFAGANARDGALALQPRDVIRIVLDRLWLRAGSTQPASERLTARQDRAETFVQATSVRLATGQREVAKNAGPGAGLITG